MAASAASAVSATASSTARRRVLIVGGGISGLSAAHYLQRSRARVDGGKTQVHLWEKSCRSGGWINSVAGTHGAVYEAGPRSLRAVGPSGRAALRLADELGLKDDVVFVTTSDVSAKNRFIYVNQKLHALPSGLSGTFRRQEPFSRPLLYYGIAEFLRGRNSPPSGADESIYDFASRRLGDEVARYLVDAMTRGIFAGDSKKLSIEACFPPLHELEASAGSILRGVLLPSLSRRKLSSSQSPLASPAREEAASDLAKRARAERWSIWSFRNGLQTLTDSLQSSVVAAGTNVTLNTECTDLEFSTNGKVKARASSGAVLEIDHVVSALGAPRLADLLANQHPRLAELLRSIRAASVAVVNVEYPMSRSAMPLQGFGHLVPSCETSDVLGIIYDSCIFPQHDRKDRESVRYTCMMGGAWMEQLFGKPSTVKHSTFEEAALKAVREQLGITVAPLGVRVAVLQDCIPQYVLGHSSRLREIDAYLSEHRLPLSLVGASYRGVSVGDCIASAEAVARRLL